MTQNYSYDSLNRLTSASASGGSYGNYGTEYYKYSPTSGNLYEKAGVTQWYSDTNHVHGITHLNQTQKYWYDANGNVTTRKFGSDTYDLAYNAEGKMVSVKKNSADYASFVYDGDGNRVKGTINGTTISYVGNYADWSGSSLTKYYYEGTVRIAMRQGSEVIFLFGDHLGSTSKTYRASDGDTKQQLYKPWGERRYPSASELPTTWRFTGQRHESDIALYFYNARWYDPSVGRFMQADTIVPKPGDVQALDRYAYALNNPLKYIDPTGHWYCPSKTTGAKCINDNPDPIIRIGTLSPLVQDPYVIHQGQIMGGSTITVDIQIIPIPSNGQIIVNNQTINFNSIDDLKNLLIFSINGYRYLLVLERATNLGKPIYKQVKYVISLGPAEYGIDAGIQFLQDYSQNKYPLTVLMLRGGITGLESLITDFSSQGTGATGFVIGEIIFPEGGGFFGYAFFSYITSKTVDNACKENLNPWLFPFLGLGNYP